MRNTILLSILPLLILAVASCATPDLTEETRQAAWVERTIENMSLEELVSQMFVVDVSDVSLGFDQADFDRIEAKITGFGAGGLVLFKSDPLSQAALVNELQQRTTIPLFVSQDMEWGAAMRVEHATEFPKAMAIAATGDPEAAFTAGQVTATEALAVGVNFILAPVADVNTAASNPVIGTRSFGDDPAAVGRFSARFISGVQSRGALAAAKHFPGHGSTTQDSHVLTPVVDITRIQSDSLDLLPFHMAIEAGVGAIMIGHLATRDSATGLSPPATFSRPIINDLLRKHLHFEGLVISDALNMAGVGELTSDSIAVAAVAAGIDLLLMPPQPIVARRAIVKAVQSGAIPYGRIVDSVRRILTTKAEMQLTRAPAIDLASARSVLTDRYHRAEAADISRRSVVALRNHAAIPIIRSDRRVLLVSLVENDGEARSVRFAGFLKDLLSAQVDSRSVPISSWNGESANLATLSRAYDVVILADLTSEMRIRRTLLQRVIRRLAPISKEFVLLAMGSPYNISTLPDEVDALLVSFGGSDPSLRASAEAVSGLSAICGKLPVTLNGSYARGTGLCIPQSLPRESLPVESGMDPEAIKRVDSILNEAIADSAFPGAAVAIGHADLIPIMKGYGFFTYDSTQAVSPRSLFDLASLTKVIATTTAIMLLYEADSLSLDDHVSYYIPEFGVNGKDAITIRDLLSHTGGLIPFRPFYQREGATRDTVLFNIYGDSLIYEPGATSRYSDFGPIILAELVERITGEPFSEYTRSHIFEPLGMARTGFRSASVDQDTTIVPTELDDYYRNKLVQGVVHDENAYLLGGTAGHAGLFSNVEDLSRFAHMILREGRIGDTVFLHPETIRLFTTAVNQDHEFTRALGWDTKSPVGYSAAGRFFGARAFGHTGFTGTSIWFDMDQSLFVILLTNRVFPTRDNDKHIPIRPEVADAAFEALRAGSNARHRASY